MKISRRIKPSHLRLVIAIGEQEQISLAADLLAISQPSASRTLSELESLLGTKLFVRHTKWMEPTEAGKALIRHGRNVLAELENLESAFDKAVVGHSGHVRLGSVTGPACGLVIPVLGLVNEQFPDIELTVEVAPSSTLIRGLKEDRLDFVVGRLGAEDDVRDFEITTVGPEEVILCVGFHHPLTKEKTVKLTQLTDYRWVMQERGSPIRQAVEATFLKNSINPPAKVANASTLLALLSFIANPNTIIPLTEEVFEMLTAAPLNTKIHKLNCQHPITVSPAYLIRLSNSHISRAALQVFDLLKSELLNRNNIKD